jgi:chromosome segregation ATPase
VTASLATSDLAPPLRPLAETAAQFRQQCAALDHLVEELYRDVEQLREELIRKADDIDDGRKRLAEKGRQLADQRKESGKLVHLLEQQETRMGEALNEIKQLREQMAQQREESQQREAARTSFLEQKLRAAEAERDQVRHEMNVLQATAAAGGGGSGAESLAPLMSELGNLRRQSGETLAQLGEARTQLAAAIERATAARADAPAALAGGEGQVPDADTLARVSDLERERIELESELELVRTRAAELQEVVNSQRREIVEQRADVTTELRLLRELVEQRPHQPEPVYEADDDAALVGASHSADSGGSAPDPVVSSVMAQFARLQKDVAQRRKKK